MEKTKCSTNYQRTEHEDDITSDGEISDISQADVTMNLRQYSHDPSLMKKRKLRLGIGIENQEHPMFDRSSPTKFKGTDLSKISNVSPERRHKSTKAVL